MDFGGDAEEEAHFGDVVLSLAEYVADAEAEVMRRERALLAFLPVEDALRFLPSQEAARERIQRLRLCARKNQEFFDRVVQPYTANIQKRAQELRRKDHSHARGSLTLSSAQQLSKARSTLHQIVREWSSEGAPEREQCFSVILGELEARLPKNALVAIPGCGLGRLVVEVAARGFKAQGSEFSYQMLLTGDCIMNHLSQKDEVTIHPWLDKASNCRSFEDTVRPITFPDVPSVSMVSGVSMDAVSICAGDFEDIYARPEQKSKWDALVWSFFLDTASNLCSYMRVAQHMLRSGGILISFGPLQWHFQPEHGGPSRAETDGRFHQSLELPLDDVLKVITSFGFTITIQKTVPNVRYASDARGMSHTCYDCEFIVAIKD